MACFSSRIGSLFFLIGLCGVAASQNYTNIDLVKLNKVEEHKSVDSYASSSSHSNKHVLQLWFKYNTGSGGGSGGSGGGENGNSGTCGGNGSGATNSSNQLYIGIDAEYGEVGLVKNVSSRLPTLANVMWGDCTTRSTVYIALNPGEEVPVHVLNTTSVQRLPKIVIWEDRAWDTTEMDGNGNPTTVHHTSHTGKWFEYDILKLTGGDSSIDTRKAFGQPNLDGALPGDANADAANVRFGPWNFKGGLFAGNMPWQTADQSGTSRFQLMSLAASGFDLTEYHPQWVAATLYYVGTNSKANSSVEIGAFLPSATDANISVSESTLNWANRWTIDPRATASSPPDFTRDPVDKFIFDSGGTTPTMEYVNFQMVKPTGATWTMPDMVWKNIAFALHDEGTHVTNGDAFWRYFAGKEYESLFSSDPIKGNSRPRVWGLNWSQVSGFYTHTP